MQPDNYSISLGINYNAPHPGRTGIGVKMTSKMRFHFVFTDTCGY